MMVVLKWMNNNEVSKKNLGSVTRVMLRKMMMMNRKKRMSKGKQNERNMVETVMMMMMMRASMRQHHIKWLMNECGGTFSDFFFLIFF